MLESSFSLHYVSATPSNALEGMTVPDSALGVRLKLIHRYQIGHEGWKAVRKVLDRPAYGTHLRLT